MILGLSQWLPTWKASIPSVKIHERQRLISHCTDNVSKNNTDLHITNISHCRWLLKKSSEGGGRAQPTERNDLLEHIRRWANSEEFLIRNSLGDSLLNSTLIWHPQNKMLRSTIWELVKSQSVKALTTHTQQPEFDSQVLREKKELVDACPGMYKTPTSVSLVFPPSPLCTR